MGQETIVSRAPGGDLVTMPCYLAVLAGSDGHKQGKLVSLF